MLCEPSACPSSFTSLIVQAAYAPVHASGPRISSSFRIAPLRTHVEDSVDTLFLGMRDRYCITLLYSPAATVLQPTTNPLDASIKTRMKGKKKHLKSQSRCKVGLPASWKHN